MFYPYLDLGAHASQLKLLPSLFLSVSTMGGFSIIPRPQMIWGRSTVTSLVIRRDSSFRTRGVPLLLGEEVKDFSVQHAEASLRGWEFFL